MKTQKIIDVLANCKEELLQTLATFGVDYIDNSRYQLKEIEDTIFELKFEEYIKSNDVIKTKKGYREQTTQYKIEMNKKALRTFFKINYYKNK